VRRCRQRFSLTPTFAVAATISGVNQNLLAVVFMATRGNSSRADLREQLPPAPILSLPQHLSLAQHSCDACRAAGHDACQVFGHAISSRPARNEKSYSGRLLDWNSLRSIQRSRPTRHFHHDLMKGLRCPIPPPIPLCSTPSASSTRTVTGSCCHASLLGTADQLISSTKENPANDGEVVEENDNDSPFVQA
jgi:hypothetical protein